MRTRVAYRNDALLIFDALDNGYARFYTGTQPGSPEDATTGTLVVELQLGSPALAAPADGFRAFNAISFGVVAASGTPGYVRFFQADGTSYVADMTVGSEIVLTKAAWAAGEPFAAPSMTISLPVGL